MNREAVLNFLMGWVRKRKPEANPRVIRELLEERLNARIKEMPS